MPELDLGNVMGPQGPKGATAALIYAQLCF